MINYSVAMKYNGGTLRKNNKLIGFDN